MKTPPYPLRTYLEGMQVATWVGAAMMFAYWQSLAVGWASKDWR